MRWLTLAVAVAATVTQVTAKAVFAHFMVGNTENYTTSDWLDDMRQAKKAHIDAFALNMAYGEATNEKSLSAAFSAAASEGMQLFFSFDYAGNGPWPKETVMEYITKYGSSSAYFHHNGKPFVSTFEGPDRADDWIDIKRQTPCFFMPDWSSFGAMKAMAAGGGVADGLFSWAAWAWGDWDMYTYTDASYAQYLNGKPYMMPVSPWFYTNLPGYNKNWIWRGDRAWGDRWIQAQWWQPEFIQIISWNDYGESHYIGPVRKHAMAAFDIGRAPFNYGTLPHDAWRDILPFVIDMYKNNVSRVDYERAVAWYMLVNPAYCDHNGTVVNTASQLQQEFTPEGELDDKIHFTALLNGKPDKVACSVGGRMKDCKVYQGPDNNGPGMYLGECGNGFEGPVQITITRGKTVLVINGEPRRGESCGEWNGFTNHNAYVAGAVAPSAINAQAADISQAVCVNGTGMELVKDLCEFTCSLGYCPKTACVCSRLGKPPTLPKPTGVQGYPTSNMDESVSGLCSFACNYGNCSDFSDYCSTKKVALAVRPASLFEPQYCDSGRARGGEERFEQLCKFSCSHGYCPFWVCVCEIEKGFANILDPTIPSKASMKSLPGLLDYGLCGFACQRGYCPTDICFDDGVYDEDEGWGPDYDPIEGEYMDFTPIEALSCDPDKAPRTLDDLVNAVDTGSIPSICWNQWALGILLQTLLGIGSEYRESLKGYDKLFSTYEKYIRESVGPQLEKFAHPGTMKSPGLKYFDCVVSINGKKYSDKQGCQYIVLERLPVDNWHIDYTLRDAKGFYAEVDEKLGIAKEWITFGEWKLEKQCDDDMYGDDGAHIRTGNRPKLCKPKVTSMSNFPIAIDKDKIEVPNPKVVMEAAMANMTSLVDSLLTGHFLVATHTNEVDSADIVTAASMPVFMLQQAVDAMNGIKKTGSDIIKQNKKNLITFILSIVLMVIPIIGEIGGALFGGMAMIARIITLIDVAGSVGMTAYDIVEDPGSAPFAIMGMLMGFVGGTRSEKSLADAGKARKAMPDSAVAKLGKVFSENDRKVQKIINACTRKR